MHLNLVPLLLACATTLAAADPTFLRRTVGNIQPKPDDLTAQGARAASYKQIFGIGDPAFRDGDRLLTLC